MGSKKQSRPTRCSKGCTPHHYNINMFMYRDSTSRARAEIKHEMHVTGTPPGARSLRPARGVHRLRRHTRYYAPLTQLGPLGPLG